ncbi:hypothetical protein [Mycoplana sp. MJR14]|uniref:hypothetical protein n=1 Tax=Mycoplana sp. MJR14 TaxID=3032583 RepID=UPI0023DAC798|nr:hypothetical protein [Mycoplana sp. MJR14]MDF1633545.1 hypothetical protein [Mycoplana sp. MJR14]
MRFNVIDGGGRSGEQAAPSDRHVRQEAERRIRASGYPAWHARSLATGAAIPRSVAYLKLQIEFVAQTLGRLDPIPADYRRDDYWPSADP